MNSDDKYYQWFSKKDGIVRGNSTKRYKLSLLFFYDIIHLYIGHMNIVLT